MNSLTPAQQQEYEAAVFEGQDPYDALKALSERTETQNIHLEGVSERGLATVVNTLTPAQQREYETAVFEGQDPYDALKALSERTETQNIHLEGVSERGLATVVNSLTPAQQREYETAVFEGQDPYDALKALSERTETQNIHQQGVYERALASAANARDAAGVIGEPGSYQKQGGITAEQRERLPVAVSDAGASLGYRGVANAGTDALANAHREEGYVQAAGGPQVNQVNAVLTSIAGSNLAIRQEYHNAAANTVKPGNVTANLAALAGGKRRQ